MAWQRLLGALSVGLLLALAAAPQPAAAVDDYLIGSDPQPHQELQETPGWVTLAFRDKANAKLAKVLVLDSAGKNVTTGPLIVEGTNVTTQLAFDLPKGTYTVMYRTSGSDGRLRGGAFQFAFGKGKWTQVDKETWIGEEEQPPVLANPDPNATQPSTATPSPSVQPTQPSASATGPATTAPTTGPTTGPAGPGADAGSALWFIGGGVLLLAAAGVGGWQWWRNRRDSRSAGGE